MMKIKNKLLKISYLAILLSGVIGLSGCVNQNNPNPDGGDTQKEWVDFVNSDEVKLTLEYSGHNFFNDGISEVKLKTAIDGDTAHFLLADGSSDELIKIRFYGIDTPESTGKIQEYGKAASNFTKEKLTKANENGTIVISSPYFEYKAPETDSTGGRYLGLVWINETKKNASIDELRLLNLEIVQNGYSWVKNLEEIPEFVETFTAAEQQARDFKLNLFSGEKDPLFNYGDYIDVSLLELKKEVEASLKDPNHVNKFDGENVRIQGTVAGYADNMTVHSDAARHVPPDALFPSHVPYATEYKPVPVTAIRHFRTRYAPAYTDRLSQVSLPTTAIQPSNFHNPPLPEDNDAATMPFSG